MCQVAWDILSYHGIVDFADIIRGTLKTKPFLPKRNEVWNLAHGNLPSLHPLTTITFFYNHRKMTKGLEKILNP
jgi:hypothetical protein